MVFNGGNPKCARHPSEEEQYKYEWIFANLDRDGNGVLQGPEIDPLLAADPKISDSYKPGISMRLQTMVGHIWNRIDNQENSTSSLKLI